MRRSTLYIIALLFVAGSIGQIVRARDSFTRPPPVWMVTADRWYEHLIGAALHASIAMACIAYDCRRRRTPPAQLSNGTTFWRSRRELRAILNLLALFLLIMVPINVAKTIQAVRDGGSPWGDTFLSLFPYGTVLAPLVAIGIVYYDRRRIRDEAGLHDGRCEGCGYDMRATPDRCPECGRPRAKPV